MSSDEWCYNGKHLCGQLWYYIHALKRVIDTISLILQKGLVVVPSCTPFYLQKISPRSKNPLDHQHGVNVFSFHFYGFVIMLDYSCITKKILPSRMPQGIRYTNVITPVFKMDIASPSALIIRKCVCKYNLYQDTFYFFGILYADITFISQLISRDALFVESDNLGVI